MIKTKVLEFTYPAERNENLMNEHLEKLCKEGYRIVNIFPQGSKFVVIVYDTMGIKDTVNTVSSFSKETLDRLSDVANRDTVTENKYNGLKKKPSILD